MPSRRDFVRTCGVAAFGAPFVAHGRYRLFPGVDTEYSARCIQLVQRSIVVDMLGLLALGPNGAKWMTDPDSFTTGDLQRFRESGISVFHPASRNRRARRLRTNVLVPQRLQRLHRRPHRRLRPHRQRRRFRAGEGGAEDRLDPRRAELRAFSHAQGRGELLRPRAARVATDLQFAQPRRQRFDRAARRRAERFRPATGAGR